MEAQFFRFCCISEVSHMTVIIYSFCTLLLWMITSYSPIVVMFKQTLESGGNFKHVLLVNYSV